MKGPKVGTWEIFIDNLPAFIDNITPTKDGSAFWAGGLMVRYGTMMDFITDKPWIRNIAAKVHNFVVVSIIRIPVCCHFNFKCSLDIAMNSTKVLAYIT